MREQVGGWTHLHVAHARPAIAGFGLATALPASHDGGRLEVGSGHRCGQGSGVPRWRREKGATGGASSKAWRRRGARPWLGEALPLGNGGQGRGARGSRAEEGEGVREAARGAELGRASAMAGRAPVHGCHDVILSNTWCVRWSPTWSPFSAYSAWIRTWAPEAKLLCTSCSPTFIKGA